jgi:cyclohexanone monooxygenase
MTAATPNTPAADRKLDLVIVGAGFAGLHMLWKARRMGWRAVVLEAAGGVGGTWYHNRYPGARVDIQSVEYSFGFDEALQQDWHWSERYAGQPELLRYANHVADRFELRRDIVFDTRVSAAHWDEAAARWRVGTDRAGDWTARFLVMATGPLSTTNLPKFPGLDSFRGRTFHTGNWPHEPVDFTGQRVGVIGTGSSAIQAIPLIARRAASLTVFQRTPAYSVPAHNGPLDAAFEQRIKAGYAQFRAHNRQMHGGFGSEDIPLDKVSVFAVSDAERERIFEERWQRGGFTLLQAFPDLMLSHEANAFAADFVRRKIRTIVRDPQVAELLCPTHPIGCKRLCVDSGYYDTYNRPNVRLVDVSRAPIDRLTPEGLTTGGTGHAFDSIVFATGFDAMTGTLMRIDLRGRGGLRIQDKWRDGPLNYLGLTVAGFPNLFHIAGPGSTAVFTNVIVAIEHHVQWIAACIDWLDTHGRRSIEATPQAEAGWVGQVNAAVEKTVYLSCNSWYLGANVPGKPRVFLSAVGFPNYVKRCTAVADSGYEGFALA